MTVVDIFFTLVQLELQQAILDPSFRNSMANINSHFKQIVQVPAFKARMGTVKQGKKQLTPLFELIAAKDASKSQKKENMK